MVEDFSVADADICRELSRLGIGKAVPKHVAPASAWRACADILSPVMGNCLRHHFKKGTPGSLAADWRDTHVVWLDKPNKPPTSVSNMRPIGLQCPTSKLLAGLLRAPICKVLFPLLQHLPQYAFTKARGTADALLRAHSHFAEVDGLLQQARVNRFQLQAGKVTRPCTGGLCISLDLSRAFDGANRPCIFNSLRTHGVPEPVIHIIQRLHYEAKYHYRVEDLTDYTVTSNGIKQGCVIAPYLWSFYTVTLMLMLREKRSQEWLENTMTLFADDTWSAWVIKSSQEFAQTIADLQLILETLESLHMTINYQKTAILLKLVGKEAARIRREATFMKGGVIHLRVQVHGRECGIPIKEEHEYLGSVVSYHRRIERNTAHRLKAGQARYQCLRKSLTGSHHLSQGHRLRLWQACVCTSVYYSLPVVGVTPSSLRQITSALTRHLRAILKLPAHLTHVTTRAVWEQADIVQPGAALQNTLENFAAKLQAKRLTAPDITTTTVVMARLSDLTDALRHAMQRETQHISQEPPDQALVSCPNCTESFVSENAMRIHVKLKHKYLPVHSTRTPTVFEPHLHAVAGMPQCRLCSRQFYRWSHLRLHIESGSCSQLGGDSLIRAPISSSQVAAPIATPPTAQTDLFEGQNVEHLPLIMREAFIRSLPNWERWLTVAPLMQELKHHCSICHQWIADYRHVRQHIHRAHDSYKHLFKQAVEIGKPFKAHLTRDRTCLFCGHKVGAPGRHVTQCVPLFQLALAVLVCREQHNTQHVGRPGLAGTPGIGHIYALLQRGTTTHDASQGAEETAAGASIPGSEPLPVPASTSTALCQSGPRSDADVSNATGARPRPLDQQDPLTTRGNHLPPSPREVLCDVHETRPGGHPTPAHDGGQGVERQEGQNAGTARVPTENAAASVYVARAPEPGPEGVLDRGRPGTACSEGMADTGTSLGIPSLGPSGQAAHPGHQAAHPACGPHPNTYVDAARAPRRDHPDLQIGATDAQDRSAGPPGHYLQTRSVTPGPNLAGDARGIRQAGCVLRDAFDRSLHQAGQPAPVPTGSTACRPDLPPSVKPQAPTETQVRVGSPPTPPTCLRIDADADAPPSVAPLIGPGFLGGRNQCYMNAPLYGVLYAAQLTGQLHRMPTSLRDRTGPAQWAERLLGFGLLGWSAPHRQHDTAEFCDHVMPRIVGSVNPGSWESRSITELGFRRYPQARNAQCLRLMLRSETFADSIDIQALINDWAAGSTAQAFTQAPHWICLQIPRFEYLAPGWAKKRRHPYLFPSLIKVPVFVAETSVDMRWDAYSVVAYVQHHGPQPNAGHYTAVLRRGTEHWLYDDEKNPTLLSPAQLEHLSTNMYLVIAVKPSHQAEHSLTPGSAYIPHADEVPRGPLAAVSEPGRLELDHITAVLTTGADRVPGEGYAMHPTGPHQVHGQGDHHGGSATVPTEAGSQQGSPVRV